MMTLARPAIAATFPSSIQFENGTEGDIMKKLSARSGTLSAAFSLAKNDLLFSVCFVDLPCEKNLGAHQTCTRNRKVGMDCDYFLLNLDEKKNKKRRYISKKTSDLKK
jgi:hypothetical protein